MDFINLKIKKIEFLLPIEYDEISSFEGSFKIKKDNKYGIYDYDNLELVLPAEYDDISYLAYGCFKVKKDNKYGVYGIKKKKGLLLPIKYDDVSRLTYDYFKVKKDNRYGIYNYDNAKLVLPVEYENISYLKNGHFKVKKDNQYDEIFYLGSKSWGFRKNNKYGLYEAENREFVLPIECDEILKLDDKFFKIKKDNQYGLYKPEKKELLLQIKYDNISYLKDEYFEVKKDNKFGVYSDKNDNFIIPVEYNSIESEYLPQNYGDKIYKCKIGKKCKKYCFDGLSGNQKNVGIVYAKTAGIILGKTVLTPIAVVGDILLDLTPIPLWGYTMSTDANGDLHVFHTYSYKLWGGWSN